PTTGESAKAPAVERTDPNINPFEHALHALEVAKKHPFSVGYGLLENAAQGIASGAGSVAEAITGSEPGSISGRWAAANAPQSEAGKEIAKIGAEESGVQSRVYDEIAGTGPLAQTLKERVPQALAAVGTVTGAAEAPRILKGPVIPRASVDSPQSLGAA